MTNSRERVIINKKKDKVIVTVRRDAEQKRHIIITVPAHMKWTTIWKILRRLPKHLKRQRKQKTKLLQKKSLKKRMVA